jgi:hypothetical protein
MELSLTLKDKQSLAIERENMYLSNIWCNYVLQAKDIIYIYMYI